MIMIPWYRTQQCFTGDLALVSCRKARRRGRLRTAMTPSSSGTALPAVKLPIFTSRVTLPLHLSPSYLAQPIEGVRDVLNRSVLQ